jgi:TPR repeat protein
MYANGQGVTQDYTEAVIWCRKAADLGNASAQYNLGIMYAQGQGVPLDYVQAHLWINRAAVQGYEEAAKIRDIVAQKMTSTQIATTQKLARKWKPKK